LHHEAIVEHDGAKKLIKEIEASAPGKNYFDAKISVLSDMIKHHLKEEEGPGACSLKLASPTLTCRNSAPGSPHENRNCKTNNRPSAKRSVLLPRTAPPSGGSVDTSRSSGQAKHAVGGLWARLGAGLVTGASDDDPSGIGTYSQAGAQFGYQLAWTLLVTYPLMVAIQGISARIGRVTGQGIAGNLRQHQEEDAKKLENPTVRGPVERVAKHAAVLAERFEAARKRQSG
jgi:hypothetical protein